MSLVLSLPAAHIFSTSLEHSYLQALQKAPLFSSKHWDTLTHAELAFPGLPVKAPRQLQAQDGSLLKLQQLLI